MVDENNEWSPTEYVTLDNRFREVFREPAIVEMVCQHTNQRIRRLKRANKRQKVQSHPTLRAYLTMVSSSPMNLHPASNTTSTSINAVISMTRLVGDMAQQEIEGILDALENGRTIVSNREMRKDGEGRKTIIIHPDAEVEHKHGGKILLRCLITPWNKYIERIDETTKELCRLRQELSDGFCDGDTQIREEA